MKLYPELISFLEDAEKQIPEISEERIAELNALSRIIQDLLNQKGHCDIIAICTHNSRRSHLLQLILHAAARKYDIQGLHTYSGGTEATAFHPNTIRALLKSGFEIETEQKDSTNPVWKVRISDEDPGQDCFSKLYDHKANPQSGFVALMVCDHASEACPHVNGAAIRFPLLYVDPKISDGSGNEEKVYFDTTMRIASEMCLLCQMILNIGITQS